MKAIPMVMPLEALKARAIRRYAPPQYLVEPYHTCTPDEVRAINRSCSLTILEQYPNVQGWGPDYTHIIRATDPDGLEHDYLASVR